MKNTRKIIIICSIVGVGMIIGDEVYRICQRKYISVKKNREIIS